MLDVGAVAARSGPPVPAEEEAAALVPAIEGLAGARACRSRPTPSRPRSRARALGGRRGGDQRHLRRLGGDVRAGRRDAAAATCSCTSRGRRGSTGRRRDYDDSVDHLRALVRGADRARPCALGVARGADRDRPRTRLRPQRRATTSRSCAGSASSRELGLPLYVSLSRKDFLGARRSPAPGRSGCRRGEREWATVAAAATLAVARRRRHPAPPRPQRRCRRCESPAAIDAAARGSPDWLATAVAGARLGDRALDPARARRPPRRRERRAERRGASTVALPALARPGAWPRRSARAGIERALLATRREALEAARRSNLVVTSGTASGKSPRLQPARCSTASPATPSAARSTSTRPRRSPRTRRASSASCGRPGLREAIYDGDTPREERPAIRRRTNLVLTNPDMLHVGRPAPPQAAGATSSPTSAGSSSTRPTPTAASSAPTSPTCCAGCAGSRAPTAPSRASCSPRRRSPTRSSSPSGWSATPFELIDDDGAPRAGARDRDVEPAADRQGDRDPALGALGGGRPAGRAGLARACGRSASCGAGAGSS